MVTLRHSTSRSMSPPPRQLSATACAARDMWPPKLRTFWLVNTGWRARLRGRHGSLGRTKRLSPARFRTSSWTMHRSAKASLRPRTSRMPFGEVTNTRGGTSQLGPSSIRVTGPPTSRSSSPPVWKTRTAFSNCR